MKGLSIVKAGREQLDQLEPLWLELSKYHAAIAPLNGAPRAPAESWRRRRRAQYERWLGNPESFVLVAHRDGEPIGYALVRIRAGSPTWIGSERVGELETLVATATVGRQR